MKIKTKKNNKYETKSLDNKKNGYLIPIYNKKENFFSENGDPQQVYLTVVKTNCIKGPHLHKVRKGYPMRGTYCEKHAAIHRQYEMLEQQMLAEEHGLSFSAYVPSMKSLNPIASGPLTTLKQQDIQNLSALGWTIKPPQMNTETREEELFRLIVENNAHNERVKKLLIEGTQIQENKEEDEWGG